MNGFVAIGLICGAALLLILWAAFIRPRRPRLPPISGGSPPDTMPPARSKPVNEGGDGPEGGGGGVSGF